jgi:hypothetical protein
MENDHNRTIHGNALGILKGKRHILFVAAVLIIVALIILHLASIHSIYKAGGFSIKNRLSYMMIGSFVFLFAFKLKFLWRFKNNIRKYFKKKSIVR